ncbi:unnamed protein product [Candida verbasci]|uniref:Phosphatidate phosphatase APP1 catalytic domain-containing protein n=1 Tax=Candida verbasci TaxID=1227364 RepID=A0A9W4XAG3_9ASCO|nr:unnamed protein product [Candida verbasci]
MLNQNNERRSTRFINFAKSTRDVYIPKVTSSISSIASKAFSNNSAVYNEDGQLLLPPNTSIHLFPQYSFKHGDKYYIKVKGWMSASGGMNRRNRMMLSVITKIIKQNNTNIDLDQDVKQEIFNPESSSSSDTESIQSNGSESPLGSDTMIRERLKHFLSKNIPNTPIEIRIGSENIKQDNIKTEKLYTDQYGFFKTTIEIGYKPTVVQVQSLVSETIFAFQDVMIFKSNGIGIISDIDDTIKITGVIGDKRHLLRNLLTKDMLDWSIPSVIDWFIKIYKNEDVNFFYVSNSPSQLFNIIYQYLQLVNLPPGSIHLKTYHGNLINSLLETPSLRKQEYLYKILQDFPEKKFICIGDSGEYDLEAYVDIARKFPSQVISINIRYVKDSFSDTDDDMYIYKELLRLLSIKRKEIPKIKKIPEPDLIDLSNTKVPPMVPKKPASLQGKQLRKPPLPERPKRSPSPTSNISSDGTNLDYDLPPPLPKRKPEFSPNSSNSSFDLNDLCSSPSFLDLQETDKKGAKWIQRIIEALKDLEGTDTKINLFMDSDEKFFKDSHIELNELCK